MDTRNIHIDIEGVTARIFYHQVQAQEVKTLVVDFGRKHRMLSTVCGYRQLRYAANHYICPPLWEHNLEHSRYNEYMDQVYQSLGIDKTEITMLVTGVDMDNFAYHCSSYKGLKVCCLATAGVKSNALRMGVDGAQEEGQGDYTNTPGTINLVLFANAGFSDGAMAMAMINITEAKAGVLQDLNVRSVYTPENIATGTGTDSIIIVSGKGKRISSTSGHLKIGELIGNSVREAVIQALNRQNGF